MRAAVGEARGGLLLRAFTANFLDAADEAKQFYL
jgi:hypothetical protein